MGKELREEIELRRKAHRESFSNYENAVTLICSLEAWFQYRWGSRGKEHAGLLESFNRFPDADGLTPDFEVRFKTPYVIWGDHKRTFQATGKGREAVDQILKYAARRPSANMPAKNGRRGGPASPIGPNYDVVVLVSPENDDVAADAIDVARKAYAEGASTKGAPLPPLAPIVVLGCHLDRESIEGEWYKLKWRDHHGNHRFTTPNVSSDPDVDDLNALIVERSHHAIPVSKPALGCAGWNPFINDLPPAIYTAIRLVIPAINSLLSNEEKDQLLSTGRVEKTLTKADLLGADPVKAMDPQPKGLGKWVGAALDFLVAELSCARKVPRTDPQQYVVIIDNVLVKGELRELFCERAAVKAMRIAAKKPVRKRSRSDTPGQMRLFGPET